jgi:tetratricopeptide (TPR) repeat protein
VAQLHRAFDDALSGQGGLMMVVGEPGIGKTAVTEQLATYVTLRGGKTLVGHCYEEGSLSLPYLAFVEALRTYVADRDPEALRDELGTGAADVARIVSEVRDRVDVELRPPGDGDDDRYRLLQAVASFLRNASAVQPLALVLEDLHWADRGTLDLLQHMARNLQGARILVVGTYRDVEVDRSHPLSGALAELRRVANFGRVLLRGLGAPEVQRMMSDIAGQDVSWGLAEAVHRQTEGNPLFIQEVIRYLVEEGLVVREGGRYRPTSEGQPLAMSIPEGLRDVIGRRLTRLSAECNRLLSTAAVIGRDFALETLRAVASLEGEALLGALEEALRVGVLEEQSRAGSVRYRFTHAFFRQTLYEEMIAPRRIRLHQEVARALEGQYAARPEEHAVELSEHFSYSSDPSDLGKAIHYGELAAQRAMGVYAYGEAAGHLERCLEVQEVLDPEDKAKRCDLLLDLADALLPAGESQRVFEDVGEEGFSLAEGLGDHERASRACNLARRALRRYGRVSVAGSPASVRWAERGDRWALPGTVERVYADLAMATLRVGQERFAEANGLLNGALELARSLGDSQALFDAVVGNIGPIAAAPGRLALQRALAEEALAWPREGVSANVLGPLLGWSGRLFQAHGEGARAEALRGELKEVAARTWDPELLLVDMQQETRDLHIAGRLEEAVAAAEALAARGEELGSPIAGLQASTLTLVPASRHLGHHVRALEAIDAVPARVGTEGPIWRAGRALILAVLGREGEARAALGSLATYIRPGPDGDNAPVTVVTSVLEAAVALGDREGARVLLGRLRPAAGLSETGATLTTPARHMGAAAVLLGDYPQARAYYAQALEAAAKLSFRPETALTRLQLAELLLDHYPNERAEAMEHLDFAIAELTDMKMQPALERALARKEILKA